MARAIRLEYPGAVYHLMTRGNRGQAIFTDDLDRQVWLKTLGQACEKTGCRIHAWVSERLRMGEGSGVSRAVRLVELGLEGEQEGLKQLLLARASRGSEGPALKA
jgi:hypothetical protein